jgi:hypothetical protein
VFCDADHAGNKITRRSHTGILMYLIGAPIMWFSKKQNRVEANTSSSELISMRIARDTILALRLKLVWFGVPIDGPADLFCDNQGVVMNTAIPESTLNKRDNAINVIRESVLMRIVRVGKEDTATSIFDLLTKFCVRSDAEN